MKYSHQKCFLVKHIENHFDEINIGDLYNYVYAQKYSLELISLCMYLLYGIGMEGCFCFTILCGILPYVCPFLRSILVLLMASFLASLRQLSKLSPCQDLRVELLISL